jgi:hypothetical protein
VPPPESHARRWFLAVFAFAALFWVYDLLALRAGIPNPLDDIWEYGVTARHLLAGEGFRTTVIHPPLWGLRDAELTVPVLVHSPLLPILFAPLLAIFGPGILDQVAWLGAAFAFFTALLVFRVGASHFGPAVGAAAAVLFTMAPLTIRAVNHDASLVVGAFLLLLVFHLLARGRPHHTAAALVLGIGVLVRPEMVFALFGLSLLAGGAGTVVLVLGVALFSGGWWWHSLRATGSPFFNLSSYLLVGYSEHWPGSRVLRDFALTPERWPQVLVQYASWLPQKGLDNLPHALKRALMTPSALTGWLAALGFLVGMARASVRWVAIAAFVCALVPVAIMSFTLYDSRYLTPFLPLWVLSAAVAAEWLWRLLPRVGRNQAWIAALVVLMLPATITALQQDTWEARGLEVRLARERAALADRVTSAAALPRLTPTGLEAVPDTTRGQRRLMFSDTPDFVAWTTGRPTVWVTRREFRRLPAASDSLLARADSLPVRGAPEDTWFHPERD